MTFYRESWQIVKKRKLKARLIRTCKKIEIKMIRNKDKKILIEVIN